MFTASSFIKGFYLYSNLGRDNGKHNHNNTPRDFSSISLKAAKRAWIKAGGNLAGSKCTFSQISGPFKPIFLSASLTPTFTLHLLHFSCQSSSSGPSNEQAYSEADSKCQGGIWLKKNKNLRFVFVCLHFLALTVMKFHRWRSLESGNS